MKIRHGFISNSSSSSFLVFGRQIVDMTIDDLIYFLDNVPQRNDGWKWVEPDDIPKLDRNDKESVFEYIKYLCSVDIIEYIHIDENNTFIGMYVGYGDQINIPIKELKDNIDKAEKLFGTELKFYSFVQDS